MIWRIVNTLDPILEEVPTQPTGQQVLPLPSRTAPRQRISFRLSWKTSAPAAVFASPEIDRL
jgi:hypothetical protein